ncbi:Histidine phosphatase superfamily (branch 1) [Vreelandella subterranea]|uniref:Histidine phosphatase superfamily (Branch 1) n=1 Tax=Vreelandella subterranea TaxID=416874 RepID=A0A1H9VFV2_9GAMM|nr:histidine phosphatase family protein [Halomonas subterranea]SES20458.1 Histidine phosphatase superfamily (branch 1) [Halomonas subterranea]
MDIFLLRHAETESNQAGSFASGSEDALTEYGKWQAQAIVGDLMKLNIEAILCSPYSRALDTVKPFAQAASLSVAVHPCLAEGQLVLDSSVSHEEPVYMPHTSGHLHPAEDEQAGAFLRRALQAKELILSQSVSKILVVTHGHMIRELLNIVMDLPEKTRFPHDNCGLSLVSCGEVNTVGFLNRAMCCNQAVFRRP